MKTIKLSVTAGDISQALKKRQSPGYSSTQDCPIACALERVFSAGRSQVRVNPGYSGLTVDGFDHWRDPRILDVDAKPGSVLADYMRQWDRRWSVKPRTFALRNRVS